MLQLCFRFMACFMPCTHCFRFKELNFSPWSAGVRFCLIEGPTLSCTGTMEAPLSLAEADPSHELPSISMVFCCVEGGR